MSVRFLSAEEAARCEEALAALPVIPWRFSEDAVEYVPGKPVHASFKCDTKALGGLFDLSELELEATPRTLDEATPVVKEAEVVASCPPPAKRDAQKLLERAVDLLQPGPQGGAAWRAPIPGKRCYVCDHKDRAVAPSRISGVLLCLLCAQGLVS